MNTIPKSAQGTLPKARHILYRIEIPAPSGRVRVGFKVFGIRRRKACLGMPTDGGRRVGMCESVSEKDNLIRLTFKKFDKSQRLI